MMSAVGAGCVKTQTLNLRVAAMQRRAFMALVGGAATWPLLAHAQKQTTPTIGFLGFASAGGGTPRVLAGVRRGLAELGYAEGQNFICEYRYADFSYDRLPILAEELVGRQVALIMVAATASLVAAKAATQTIPILFTIGSDPVENGFVASLNKPGGNITGIFTLNLALAAKRLEMLNELIPAGKPFAFLTNASSPKFSEPETRNIRDGAHSLGLKLLILDARNRDQYEAAFAAAHRAQVGGLVVGSEGLFINAPEQLVILAERYQLPVIYADDKPARNGGLISYGADQDDGFRQVGLYAGRVLRGERPIDLPVQQSTKTRLVINLKTAKTLGLSVPVSLLARADEVIE
jgi:putative ABC transport system substrate-binding protein